MFLSTKIINIGVEYTGTHGKKAEGINLAKNLCIDALENNTHSLGQVLTIWDFSAKELKKRKVDTFIGEDFLKEFIEMKLEEARRK